MNILVIDNGSRDLTPLLSKLSSHAISVISFTDFDFGDPNTSDTDFIILPGASQYDIPSNSIRFEKEGTFIRNTSIPLLGICFGAELIAHAYDGAIRMLPEKIEGVREIKVAQPHHSLFGGRTHLQVRESHHFAISSAPLLLLL